MDKKFNVMGKQLCIPLEGKDLVLLATYRRDRNDSTKSNVTYMLGSDGSRYGYYMPLEGDVFTVTTAAKDPNWDIWRFTVEKVEEGFFDARIALYELEMAAMDKGLSGGEK